MGTRPLVAALALLALLGAAAPLAGTQAAEIGEGVEIQPADGPNGAYAQVGDDGQVSIQLDGDAAVPGGSLPADALAHFDRVLLVVNDNTAGDGEGRQAYVYVRDEGGAAEDFDFYRGTAPGGRTSIEGQDNAVRLDTGESASVGFEVDTREDFEAADLTLTVVAEVSEIADAVLAVETGTPTADEPVTFNATGSDGDAIAYVYDFGDGTVASDAGPTTQHVFNETGTYEVNLTVEETAPRAPNGSDSVTRTVVVWGGPQTGNPGEAVGIPDPVPGGPEPALQSVLVDPDESTTGDVSVRALAAESAADVTGTPPEGSTVVGAADISLSNNPDADATVSLTVADSAVPANTSPADLAIERYNGTGWEVLPTDVEDASGDTVTLVGDTPGFSVFAVTVNDAPALDDDPTPGGGGGGGGGGDVDLGDDDDDAVDDAGDDTDEGVDDPDAPDDVDDGADDPVDDADGDAPDDGADADGADGGASPDGQPPDGELGGIGLLPTLGIAAVLAILAAVAFIRIRRRE